MSKLRLEKMVATNSSGWPWRQTKKEEEDWRLMELPNAQVGHVDRRGKKSKTGEDGSYYTAQVGPGNKKRKKSKTGTSVR